MSDSLTAGAGSTPAAGTEIGYGDALERVMSLVDFERSTTSGIDHKEYRLERMDLLVQRLGDPHLGPPAVHIAGTNGKGSTAAMVTAALSAAGYRPGLYTSPHLHSAIERVRIGLEPIDRQGFAVLVGQAWPAVEWVGRCGGFGMPSFFETLTAMAFLHFQQAGVDSRVIEVGLGGRLDATNVVAPEVCVITPISLDHVATLGNTVALIAAEKAGIIKEGVPVVVAPQSPEAMDAIVEAAVAKGAPLVDVAGRLSWRKTETGAGGQSFELDGLSGRYDLRCPLLGDHQLENAATAVATLETLDSRGLSVHHRGIVEGIRTVDWSGRLQVLSRRGPQVVVDGAHNPGAMRRLVDAVLAEFRYERVVLVFGGLSGHSALGMLEQVSRLSPAVVAVRSRHPRSAHSEDIAAAARQIGLEVCSSSEDVGRGLRKALDIAGQGDLVLGTGSLSVAAEIIEDLEGTPAEVYPSVKRPQATSLPLR